MSNPIPPLLCYTPPPIDFRETNIGDEDFGSFESADVSFGQFDDQTTAPISSSSNQHRGIISFDPPKNDFCIGNTTDFRNEIVLNCDQVIPESHTSVTVSNKVENVEAEVPEKLEDCCSDKNLEFYENFASETSNSSNAGVESDFLRKENTLDSVQDESTRSSREGSLQSLELYIENVSDEEDDDESASFPDYREENKKCDDNISLPSLKFDSVGTSKNTTPTFDTKQCPIDIPSDYFVTKVEKNIVQKGSLTESSEEKVCTSECSTNLPEISENNLYCETESTNFAVFDNCEFVKEYTNDTNEITQIKSEKDFKTTLNTDSFANSEAAMVKAEATGSLASSDRISLKIENFDKFDIGADFGEFASAAPDKAYTEGTGCGTETNKHGSVANTELPIEEDDEFGGFYDFKDCSNNLEKSAAKLPPDLGNQFMIVLKNMFPIMENNVLEKERQNEVIYEKIDNNIVKDLKELDTARALNYQWINSNAKHSLIKSLGIDSRNILYGEKWNCTMPRFAANLGLEPLKPVSQSANLKTVKNEGNNISNTSNSMEFNSGREIPAVQFDWNTSGLVNPLDGIKEILHERKIEEILSAAQYESDHARKSKDGSENRSTTDIIQKKECASTSISINNSTEYINDFNEAQNNQREEIKNKNNLVPSTMQTAAYVVPLKETHIFAPSKDNIICNTKPLNSKCPLDFDYEIAATGIIINEQVVKKEYRDVEYNPNKLVMNNLNIVDYKHFDDISNLDSGKKAEIFSIELGAKQNKSDLIESPSPNTEGDKNIHLNSFLQFDKSNINTNFPISSHNTLDENNELPKTNASCDNFAKPSNSHENQNVERTEVSKEDNKTVRESHFDDEFCDFQCSIPTNIDAKDKQSNSYSSNNSNAKLNSTISICNDEMILSPSILLPQASSIVHKSHSSNIHSTTAIDLDETLPHFQLPIKNKNPEHETKDNSDDEDWNDFVSGPINTKNTNPSNQLSNTNVCGKNKLEEDDWSDFISSYPESNPNTTVSILPSVQWNAINSVHGPPKFNDWNQPNFPPSTLPTQVLQPIRNNTEQTNIACSMPTNSIYHIPSKSNIDIFTNYSENINNAQKTNAESQTQGYIFDKKLHASHSKKEPSVSLIPDLGFAEPRSFINTSKGNFIKK